MRRMTKNNTDRNALTDADSLHARVMALADRMDRKGATADATAMRISMARIREALSGAEQDGHVVNDVERVALTALSVATIMRRYLDINIE
jgi:hypothetical protein